MRIEQLRQHYEVGTRWLAFPLHPDTPEDGLTLKDLFKGAPVDMEGIRQRLKQVADELGLPLTDRRKTYNSRLAQELAKWAESKGMGDEFHGAAFRAYFVDGKNIGKAEVLVDLAKSLGLSAPGARTVLDRRTWREAVDTDWARSRTLGVTAVPTFLLNGRGITGFQPYRVLEAFLKSCGVKERRLGAPE